MALRLLSYNILAGGEDRLPLIASLIQKQQADVVALVEANSRANAEALAQQLGMSLLYGEGNGKAHVAWLSHLPVIHVQNHPLPVLAKTLLEIEILWEGILLQAGYVDCYRALHPTTPGYTSHTDHPAVRVDYIFASPPVAKQLYACDLVTGPEAERASDHFTLWAELQ